MTNPEKKKDIVINGTIKMAAMEETVPKTRAYMAKEMVLRAKVILGFEDLKPL